MLDLADVCRTAPEARILDPIQEALIRLHAPAPADIAATVALLAEHDIMLDSLPARPVLIEMAFLLLDALEDAAAITMTDALLDALDPAAATIACDLLYLANFPNGAGNRNDLSDAAILALVLLLGRSEQTDHALTLLDKAVSERPVPRFAAMAYAARCRLLGLRSGVAA